MKTTTAIRLASLMEARSLKQCDIVSLCKPYCERYGVIISKNNISQYINGKTSPNASKLSILGMALNVSEAWLMGYDVPMERETPISVPSKNDSKEADEFSDLSAQEKTLIRLFREASEEGRLEMISAFMNIIKKYRKDVRIIYRAASSSNNEDHRLEVRTEADLEKFKKATPVTSEDDL